MVQQILQWFDLHGRDLPWRHTTDPYAIWLSEIILQQTRVQQGMAYWQRFMDALPTVEALAEAEEDVVMRLWQGLGYYSRARNLHTAAKQIVALGHFPCTHKELLQLKGVGPYTAAAIGSFAFHLPLAAVDGNVYRVLARYHGIDTPINSTQGVHLFDALAQDILPKEEAGQFNQAMMDFGATVCTPQSPQCNGCILADSCVALRTRRVEQLPVKLRTVKVKKRTMKYLVILCDNKIALHRRGAGDIWQALWEPLNLQDEPVSAALSRIKQHQKEWTTLCKGMKHVLTHRILTADFMLWQPIEKPTLPPDYQWIDLQQLHLYALPRMIEKALEQRGNSTWASEQTETASTSRER